MLRWAISPAAPASVARPDAADCDRRRNLAGIWLVRVTPTAAFYQIAYVLVFLLSLALVYQGATALWLGAAV